MLRSQITALSGAAIFNRRNENKPLKIAPPDPEVEKLRMQYYSIRKKYMKAYVKRQTANKINRVIGRNGKLWQKESFDTTIRDHKHLMNAINYTLNNPVAAGFVKDWGDWPGSWYAEL